MEAVLPGFGFVALGNDVIPCIDGVAVFDGVNVDGTKASLGGFYLSSILNDFNSDIRKDWPPLPGAADAPQISVLSSNWYNPFLNYDLFIVPAILVTLVTALAGIIPVGSLLVLYVSLVVYLFAMLGLGLLVATYSNTQMQAMSLSFFFIMIFNMMSGVFNSVDSMPGWAQALVETFPPSHFIKVMRMVVLKGSGFGDIDYHLAAVAVIGILLNSWAVWNYRKTSG